MSAPTAPAGADSGDKQLARVKGEVGYRAAAAEPFKPVFGRQDLADDAIAETHAGALGSLTLRDSSEIEIGANTSVQVGAFNAIGSGNPNVITLNHGALHFNVRHPSGAASNYKFTTTTSQIAVRGTEGYLVSGPNGTQIACVSCVPGDVTVTTGSTTTTIVSGQTLTITGTSPTTVQPPHTTPNTTTNNPQINQFTPHGVNPFAAANVVQSAIADPTIAVTTSTAVTTGTIAAAAAVAAAGTAAVVQADQPKSTPEPTAIPSSEPSPSPSPSSGATTGSVTVLPTFLSIVALNQPNYVQVTATGGTETFTIPANATCNGDGAAATISPSTLPQNGGTLTVIATQQPSAPPAPPGNACSFIITGTAGYSQTVYLNITTTGIGVQEGRRKKL
jgi:hypothetical protein